ncbi:MAG: TonB-dependent receptor [Bacteroidales bacterium]|nr:TonB-dependent receptor [Bacteroidales bacterium]MDT8430572.1 TonB-dependent receptor [Bacteroidales bacterium]
MKQVLKLSIMMLMALVFATSTNAQLTVTGRVQDLQAGVTLPGASIIEDGTENGTITNADGSFSLRTLASSGNIRVSYVGYETVIVEFSSGSPDLGLIEMSASLELGEVVIVSGVVDVAKIRETPVAVSSIGPAEIALKVGNQEFPEIMNTTPGVYATKQAGGYGDSRISLRGFDQRNTSFLINGQPVNDMENGWVYWSNWKGLTDVASGIQIQRGLGASRLAVPSVGGTVSIFTKAAKKEKGGLVSQTIGNDGYLKTSLAYNTGRGESGWAASVLASRWQGNGYAYGTSGQGWTYFAAVGYEPEGSKHAMNLSILGAGQWHHQRSSWISIRDYQNFGEEGLDRRWNTDAGFLDGEEFNMRRNHYNKPLATFNWDYEINSTFTLNTSLYGSAGRGGGTGPRGQNFRNPDIDMYPYRTDLTNHYLNNENGTRDADGFVDFDAVVRINQSTTEPYDGDISGFSGLLIGSNGYQDNNVNRAVLIRRSSMNSHDWVGAISNLEGQFGNLTASLGVDLRYYKGYHYRVLNNLMGLDGYYSTGNDNSAGLVINTLIDASPFRNTGLNGPKIDYYNIGVVGWSGVNGMVEYNDQTNLTAVIQGGLSNQSFQRIDYFDQSTNPISETKSVGGGYIKGGANYNLTASSNVFFNTGYISRQPNFDAVFPNFANAINEDLQNEEIFSVELGYGYITNNLKVNVNAYSTNWGNRFISRALFNAQGDEGIAQFRDIDVNHKGIEVEANYRPMSALKLKGMVSAGDWRYTKDFTSVLFDADQNEIGTGTLYLKDAKVGDAAQFVTYLSADYRISNFNIDLGYRYVDGLYADYSVTDDIFAEEDNPGALKLPAYGLLDAGVSARFNIFGNLAQFRFNVNNILDKVYISESETNIHADENSETWEGIDVTNSVWFGFGRTWNVSVSYNF